MTDILLIPSSSWEGLFTVMEGKAQYKATSTTAETQGDERMLGETPAILVAAFFRKESGRKKLFPKLNARGEPPTLNP